MRPAPDSTDRRPWHRRLHSDDRGVILAMVAIMGVVMLGMTGLVVDLGLAFITRAQISRAVDAGVLAGARSLRNGESAAQAQAYALAAINGVSAGDGAVMNVGFGTNEEGESTVWMTAAQTVPTIFLRAIGTDHLDVNSSATAAVPPVDLVMVLDQSGSLERNGAFDELQDAAKDFLDHFDDTIDQLGLVSFQLRAANRFALSHNFTSGITSQINAMVSAGDTNIAEGLRFAYEQMQSPTVRERSSKVVVFFTDGRATAFRGRLGSGGPWDGGDPMGPFEPNPGSVEDRLMAVYTTTSGLVRGYFDDPDDLPYNGAISADGCVNVSSCWGWNENEVRDKARDAGLEVADAIRGQGIYIYSIGLGDPAATAMEQPDLPYLRQISNEDGIADSSQPRGRSYFSPSEAELESVFNQVAQDLLVRLAQ